ncbi:MAG: type II secretion system protein GspM [Cellvibrionaceae bacterium]
MNWFYQQNRREQIALIVCAICVSVYLVWMLGLKPLANATAQSKTNFEKTSASLAKVKSLAITLKYHEQNAKKTAGSGRINIANLIDSSTKSNGLNFATLNPSRNGEEATVRFDNAVLSSIVQWVYELETVHSVQVQDLNLVAASQPGQAMVTIRLRKN